jgi:GNAT superfamily N-acetyltransferase
MNTTFTIRPATVGHQQTVIDMIDEAAKWLRDKNTDQWARPWPDQPSRDGRVRRGLELGETWIVWDGDFPAATMTVCQHANPDVWPRAEDPAVYVHRLVVSRTYAGLGLGRLMVDWAVQRELTRRHVDWVRVDVWTTNTGLHDYYLRQGFERCGTCADPRYPSGALFQKAAKAAQKTDTSRLVEDSAKEWRHTAG